MVWSWLSTIQSKLKAGQKVEVLYDRTDLGSVYVRDPSTGVFHQADAPYDYQYGLSMFEHELVQKKLKAEGQLFTGEVARLTLLRIQQRVSDSIENNSRRKQDHRRNARREEGQNTSAADVVRHDTHHIDEYIDHPEEIDLELIDDTPDYDTDDDDDYETFQLPRKN